MIVGQDVTAAGPTTAVRNDPLGSIDPAEPRESSVFEYLAPNMN